MSLKPWWNYPAYDDPKYANVPPPVTTETSKADQALDEDHLAAYVRAITNVLATELAESTFAQLVDGLPLWDVVHDIERCGLEEDEPVFKHRQLCPDLLGKTRAFRATFNPGAIDLRTNSVPVGSRTSKLPLIELVAVSVHAIAAQLFKQADGRLNKNETYPSDEYHAAFIERRKKPTPFSLWRYDDPKQYPDGNADIAAYWAEDQIFGGIVLFDRGESGTEV